MEFGIYTGGTHVSLQLPMDADHFAGVTELGFLRVDPHHLEGGVGRDQLDQAAPAANPLDRGFAVDDGHATAVTGFRTAAVERDGDRLALVAEDGRRSEPVDEVIALTGLRPDLSYLDEVRLALDERLQAPVALAPLVDPNVHSCGTVYPHGATELSHPETGVYLAGMKSYGRAPTFLAMTGFEQVRSIAAALAGDHEAAARVELTLPETGVCSGSGLAAGADTTPVDAAQAEGCCAAPAAGLIQIGTTSGGC